MSVIEIGAMGVKPNHKVMDPSTPEGQILEKAWSSVTAAPGGPYWAYGGLEVDDPDTLWGFFAFDSVEHHEAFAKKGGAEAVKDLPRILTHSIFMKHISMEEDMSSVLQSPATAVTLFYFPSTIAPTENSRVSTLARESIGEKLSMHTGVKAVCFGWSVEDDVPVLDRTDKGDTSGNVFAVFVGWSSVENMRAFHEAHENRGVLEKIGEDVRVTSSLTRYIQCREFGASKGR